MECYRPDPFVPKCASSLDTSIETGGGGGISTHSFSRNYHVEYYDSLIVMTRFAFL